MSSFNQSAYRQSSGNRAGVQALRALLQNRSPLAADIARAGGFSAQYAHQVLSGARPASVRFIEAARTVGFPVDLLWPDYRAEATEVTELEPRRLPSPDPNATGGPSSD
jgi:hypothetical protein